MITEEDFKDYKVHMEAELNKKKRTSSIVLAISSVVTVLFMIYGFTQSIEAARQRDVADIVSTKAQAEVAAIKSELAKCQSEKK